MEDARCSARTPMVLRGHADGEVGFALCVVSCICPVSRHIAHSADCTVYSVLCRYKRPLAPMRMRMLATVSAESLTLSFAPPFARFCIYIRSLSLNFHLYASHPHLP